MPFIPEKLKEIGVKGSIDNHQISDGLVKLAELAGKYKAWRYKRKLRKHIRRK